MKVFAACIIFLIAVIGTFVGWQYYQHHKRVVAISSFKECAELYPVMESYPALCVTSDGRSFTQEIGNEHEYQDEIVIESPRLNQVISSPLLIKGKARGSWFFEGSFSAELFDGNNGSLGTIILSADGEWMTEKFVSFEGNHLFNTPPTSIGKLIFRNANPSGLAENQKELIMPVFFKR